MLLILFIVAKSFVWPLFAPHPHTEASQSPNERADTQPLVLSKSFVDGRPFGADSIFIEGRDRVHAFSKIPGLAGTSHVWYHGGDSVAAFPCTGSGSCLSSLSVDSLHEGEWSVDLVIGRHLLASRQFQVKVK